MATVSQLLTPTRLPIAKLKEKSGVAPARGQIKVNKELLELFNKSTGTKNSGSKSGKQELRDRNVSTVTTQPNAVPRTERTPLIPKDAEEKTELTCCQKVMKAVCCCFSS